MTDLEITKACAEMMKYEPTGKPASEPAIQVRECGNCNGSGYDLTGVIAAGGKTVNRVCHVCNGTGTAPSPVGLPEEPFSRGAVEMEAYLSMFSGSVDMAFADYVRKLRAYSSAAEQLRDENLEIKRAHLDEHLRANAAEQRVGELERHVHAFEEMAENERKWKEQLQRELDAARACIRDADALTRKFIDKVESGGAFSKTTYAECVKFQADHKAALAHREPAGGEQA